MAEPLFFEGTIAVCFSILYLFAITRLKKRSVELPYPPGPKPLPVIGNALDLPRRNPQQKYRQWRQKYGESFYVEVGFQLHATFRRNCSPHCRKTTSSHREFPQGSFRSP